MNAILTIAENLKYYDLYPFLKSFRAHNDKDDIIVLYSKISQKSITKLSRFNVTFIHYEGSAVVDDRYLGINDHLEELQDRNLSPNSSRYFFYYAFLISLKRSYSCIILSDIRDVYFQSDPFSHNLDTGLTCFLEDLSESIGKNKYMRIWLTHSYGESVLNNLSQKPISCSGFTIGDYPSITRYLKRMILELLKFNNIGGLDQGIHNYIIYTNKISNVHLVKDDEGLVTTISYFKDSKKIKFNKIGDIINAKSQLIPVIHQYDRNWKLLWNYNKPYFFVKRWNLLKKLILQTQSKITGNYPQK